jgi:hypothetical protein
MASYLGISRVRVYQLIKAGLPLTSFEEASAWRAGRKPGHPKRISIDLGSMPITPNPGVNAALPDTALLHTDTQFLAFHPVIKGLAQSCTPSDSNWEGMSSMFCNFDSMLLQFGVNMQRVFGVSLSAVPGLDTSKIPPTTQCGQLAQRLKLVAKFKAEKAAAERRASDRRAAKKRAAELRAAEKRLAALQCTRVESTPVRAPDVRLVPAFKSPEKTVKKPNKKVEVVVTLPSDDEEHIDGVTDWIGALLHARHLLPAGPQSSPASKSVCLSSQTAPERNPQHPSELSASLCLPETLMMCDELRLEVAAMRGEVEREASAVSAMQVNFRTVPETVSSKSQSLKAKLDALMSSSAIKAEKLADMEAQLAALEKNIKESLERVPLDTRSQFLVEVCQYQYLLFLSLPNSCAGA